MSTKSFVVAGLVAAAIGIGVGYVLTADSVLTAAAPNPEMAPDTIIAWAQVDGLAPIWNEMQATPAWADFQASSIAETFAESPTGKAWKDLAARIESKAGYGVDAARSMRFLGKSVSVGLDAVPAQGNPGWLVLAKLDVAGLVGDVLAGRGDWRDLHGELERRTGAMEFQIRRSEHLGFDVTTASRGDVVFHAAILGDTLAVSDSESLLHRTISVHDSGGVGSLGRTARFRDEVARLPKGAVATQWIDFEAGRRDLDRLKSWLTTRDPSRAASGAVARVLTGSPGAQAVAMAAELPGADPYRARWSCSRTAAEFAGRPAPADVPHVVGDGAVVLELRDVGRVATAWNESSLRKRLSAGPIGRKFRAWFDDPQGAMEAMGSGPFGRLVPGAGRREFEPSQEDEENGAAQEDDSPLGRIDAFTLKMARAMAQESFAGSLTGDGAVAVDRNEDGSPGFRAVVGLGPLGHLASLAAEGAALGTGRLTGGAHGAVPYVATDGSGTEGVQVHWAHVGGALVVAGDLPSLRAALDRAAKDAPAGTAAPAVAATVPGDPWTLRVRVQGKALLDAIRGFAGDEAADEMAHQWFDHVEMTVHVDDRLTRVEMRSSVLYSQDQFTRKAAGPKPRAWNVLPETAILAAGGALDFGGVFDMVIASVRRIDPEGADRALSDASTSIGVDIRKELLPALGPEFAIGVLRRAAPAAAGQGEFAPFIPGIVLMVEVRDEAVARRAFDGMIALIEEDLAESPRGRREPPFRIFRETAGRMTVVRLEPGAGQPPFLAPTFAIGEGRFLVGLDADAVDACLDAVEGRATSFGASPLLKRVQASLPEPGDQWMVHDWSRMLDQIAEYAPTIAEAFPVDELEGGRKRPDFPMDGNQADFDRYQRESEAFERDAAGQSVPRVKEWIEAFRWIDFVAGSTVVEGRDARTRLVVRFLE